jgi:hypothetical protein
LLAPTYTSPANVPQGGLQDGRPLVERRSPHHLDDQLMLEFNLCVRAREHV